jgi:hypothetical protein
MKPLLALLLVLLPVADALVSASVTVTPTTGTVGEPVVLRYTRTSSLLDGLQNGTVTPRITGATNVTLASQEYHFIAVLTVNATKTLNWTWTPTQAGNYTVTFTDHPTQGSPQNATTAYHIEGAGGGGGFIEESRAPWRVPLGLVLLVLGLGALVFSQPKATRNRSLRITGIALLALAGLAFASILWW